MKVITITNAKGGTGKTTTAVNLGAGLVRSGYKTLLVDLDPQANATANLLGFLPDDQPDILDVLEGKGSLPDIVWPSNCGLHIAPMGGDRLVLPDGHVPDRRSWALALKDQLAKVPEYRFVIVDTAPTMGELTVIALGATDHIIVPVSAGYLPLIGIKNILDGIELIRDKVNGSLKVLGFLLTMFDRRESISESFRIELSKNLGALVFNTLIRINTRLKVYPYEKATVFEAESPSGRSYQDYEELTHEVLSRLKLKPVR